MSRARSVSDARCLPIVIGAGWVEDWGGQRREIKAGDVVWSRPGVTHWHGGTAQQDWDISARSQLGVSSPGMSRGPLAQG